MARRKPKKQLTLDQMLALPDPAPEYVCRFIPHADRFKLVNLYHLARTALCTLPAAEQTPYHRMRWACEAYTSLNRGRSQKEGEAAYASTQSNPAVSPTGAYKDLCGLLDR